MWDAAMTALPEVGLADLLSTEHVIREMADGPAKRRRLNWKQTYPKLLPSDVIAQDPSKAFEIYINDVAKVYPCSPIFPSAGSATIWPTPKGKVKRTETIWPHSPEFETP